MSAVVNDLYMALTSAFSEFEGAVKDRANPAFKGTKYADLASVVDAIKPALIKHGLFFIQVNHERDGGVCVETRVIHKTGGSLSFGELFVPASKQDAQGYGSALTYARRYALMTAFGICPEDDDGNAASAPREQDDRPRQQQTQQQAATGDADKWVRTQINKFAGFDSFDKLSAHVGRETYTDLKDALKLSDPKLWQQVDDAERTATARLDDVPFA